MTLPWAKVFRDKLRSSIRIRALKLTDYGVYMHVMMAAGDDGVLQSGSHIWTLDDIALECNATRGRKRIAQALQRLLDDGLLRRRDDGAYVVANWAALQSAKRAPRPRTKRRGGGQGTGPRPISDDLSGWSPPDRQARAP